MTFRHEVLMDRISLALDGQKPVTLLHALEDLKTDAEALGERIEKGSAYVKDHPEWQHHLDDLVGQAQHIIDFTRTLYQDHPDQTRVLLAMAIFDVVPDDNETELLGRTD